MKIKILEFLKNKKGSSGIGTLIVFIAMVLVAAVAASVLINTSGFLQQKASSTGKESTEQVASGLLCSGVSGHIDIGGGNELDRMVMCISPNAGSAPIDLKQAKLFLTYDGKSVVLKYGGTVGDADGSQNIFGLTNKFKINFTNDDYPDTNITFIDNTSSTDYDKLNISTSNNKLIALLKGLNGNIDSIKTNDSNVDTTKFGTIKLISKTYNGKIYTVLMNLSTTDAVTSNVKVESPNWTYIEDDDAIWGGANDKQFLIAPLQDNDKSVINNGVINKGDIVAILVNSQAALDKEIPERATISGKLQPEFGAPAVVDFTTPVAYTKEVMELQ